MARPRRNGIDRFNIAVDLTDNKKFGAFLEYSGLSDGLAWLVITRFWNFIAVNYALDGEIKKGDDGDWIEVRQPKISHDDKHALRRFCFYQGGSDDLIRCLQKAGFLGEDLTVIEWFTHQPMAAHLVNKRSAGSKGGKAAQSSKTSETPVVLEVSDGLLGVSDDKNPSQFLIPNSNTKSISSDEEILPSKASDARARAKAATEPSRPSSSAPPRWKPPPEIELLAIDLLKAAGIGDRQDRRDIAYDVYHAVKAGNYQQVHILIAEIKAREHEQCANIVAVIRSKLRKYHPKEDHGKEPSPNVHT